MPGKNFTMEGYSIPGIHFAMKTLEVMPYGKLHIHFPNTKSDIYSLSPSFMLHVYTISF